MYQRKIILVAMVYGVFQLLSFICVSYCQVTGTGNNASNWGHVQVRNSGKREAILENRLLKCRYGRRPSKSEDVILELVIKKFEENQASPVLDACAKRDTLTHVEVVYDGSDRKTVRLEWHEPKRGTLAQEVSIFPDRLYLKIHYMKHGVNIVDIASPGGASSGRFAVYGAENWHRQYIRYPNSYYNRFPKDVGKTNITAVDPENGGALNYHGWFIMGIYNPENGRGYGRAMPVWDIIAIKLLTSGSNRGFELFPHYGTESNRNRPFTGYLYVVTHGAEEIISIGKRLADGYMF